MSRKLSRIDILKSEYPGDIAWMNFVSSLPELETTELTEFNIEENLAKAIFFIVGENSIRAREWLLTPSKALDGKTAFQLLELPDGEKILRTVIMRSP